MLSMMRPAFLAFLIFFTFGIIFFQTELYAAVPEVGDPVGVAAPSGVPDGAVRAEPEHREEIEAAGLTYTRGMLWDPKNPYVGIEAGDAKNYLLRKSADSRQGIMGLNAEFACRLARFLKTAEAAGYNMRISSGFRTYAQQAALKAAKPTLAARPGSSNHERGLAADLSPRGADRWAHANAAAYGLRYPIRGEPWHVEPSGGTSGGSSCGDLNAGPSINPGIAAPSSGIASAARDLLNPQQQMCPLPGGGQVPCSAIANPGGQQPLAQGQQPQLQQPPQLGTQNTTPFAPGTCEPKFYCANSTYYYRSSTCVDQAYQKCPAGCSTSGNACASTSTSSTNLPVIDQIGLIAEPTSTPSGTVSDLLFELAISGDDIATLQDESDHGGSTVQGNPYVPPASQQTFVSGDLRYSQAELSQPQLSTLQRTLAIMKDTLLGALAYLRPFGSRAATFDVNELPGE
ncbi:D-alanyl-D-alanine carboxypeptidase family protein [Candidatus Kaiserbacteria bacterium]|nr:D-alanyl-D-alanine carboxypeptidase family protein [Candidatus Kaiserbacteria bacterium]